MSPTLMNFLFEAGNFLLLAAALGWFLFRPIRSALDEERKRHERQTRELAEATQATEEQRRTAEQALKQAKEQLETRRKEVLAEAEQEALRIKQQAEAEQALRREALQRELAEGRHAQLNLLADAMGRLAARSVRTLLETLDGPDLDLALVRRACHQLRDLPDETRKSATVDAARPLGREARELLQSALNNGFQERLLEALGAGVRITTGAGQVDASATSIARKAAADVNHLAHHTIPQQMSE